MTRPRREHILYVRGDFKDEYKKDPEYTNPILDRNGDVVLSQCKICRRAEQELVDTPYCPGYPKFGSNWGGAS